MAYADLRDFIQRLDAEGELIRISTPVSAHLEITEITDRVSKGPAAQNKALLFEHVAGSSMPVLINAMGNPHRMALALGVDGLPIITYWHEEGHLNIAHCEDLACGQATITTLDNTGNVGRGNSVAVGAGGLPFVVYVDSTNDQVKAAHCNNVACTETEIITVDELNLLRSTAVVNNTDGLPLIWYFAHVEGGSLYYAVCENRYCTERRTARAFVDAPEYSLTIGSDGLPVMALYDGTDKALKLLHCSDQYCRNSEIYVVDDACVVKDGLAMTIGVDGLPLITYFDDTEDDLKVAHCRDLVCSRAIVTTVDQEGEVGRYNSVTIGADGLPLIAYRDESTDSLKVAHCSNQACTESTRVTIPAEGGGYETSVILGMDGLPLITHVEASDIRVVHCSNRFCVPYHNVR